ncbi:MAG: ECF transporter S component, partial [Oscillospiraceae bacterium]|nr:ECF transporter S component [Oscillospiraceae bacterium]
MKNTKVYVTAFCGVAIAMNIILGIITAALAIPLYLDTLGTVLTAAMFGPIPGMIVGCLTNVITGLIYSVSDIPFALVNMAVGLV